MTQIVVDAGMLAKLKLEDVKETVQFTDETGRVLGRFVPLAEDLSLQPKLSDEEIDRRLSQGPGRSLDQILDDLQRRG